VDIDFPKFAIEIGGAFLQGEHMMSYHDWVGKWHLAAGETRRVVSSFPANIMFIGSTR